MRGLRILQHEPCLLARFAGGDFSGWQDRLRQGDFRGYLVFGTICRQGSCAWQGLGFCELEFDYAQPLPFGKGPLDFLQCLGKNLGNSVGVALVKIFEAEVS